MSEKSLNVLVFGATGVIGRFIIAQLVANKADFNRIAIFTSLSTISSKSPEIQRLRNDGVEIIVGDVNLDSDVLKAYQGIDTVICAFGRNVIGKQIDLIRIAEESKYVKWFFPSEFGTDIEYEPGSRDEIPHQEKLRVRTYIREHVKELGHTYIVTGPYPELFVASSPDTKMGTFDVRNRTATIVGTGDERIGFTTMHDVGRFVVAALKRPTEARNQTLKVQSFVATQNQIISEFEKQTATKWGVEYVPFSELTAKEKLQWAEENPIAPIYTLRRIWIGGGTLYDHLDNESLGVLETDNLEKVIAHKIRTGGGSAIQSGKLQ
ncbi:uncharacterized protein PV09_08200 [Verruconis gallopava]|uniref:NmrA-like domain-containing protein n=1 Tax=Verruconis gallopava TaxID=253628 RepID=A0A0D2A0X1_9PEZI|nr:uncharacterized protein PV09_08200 [Verruconis gallopava]KIW00313.1 hypothetical protein PV09_08200 [Verruconis gallopava]